MNDQIKEIAEKIKNSLMTTMYGEKGTRLEIKQGATIPEERVIGGLYEGLVLKKIQRVLERELVPVRVVASDEDIIDLCTKFGGNIENDKDVRNIREQLSALDVVAINPRPSPSQEAVLTGDGDTIFDAVIDKISECEWTDKFVKTDGKVVHIRKGGIYAEAAAVHNKCILRIEAAVRDAWLNLSPALEKLFERIKELESVGKILAEKIEEYEDAAIAAMEDNTDKQHCSCVRPLKVKIKELEDENDRIDNENDMLRIECDNLNKKLNSRFASVRR